MSNVKSEVFEAFRSISVPEAEALKAAAALSRRDADVEDLKSDMRLLKWMVGTTIALELLLFGVVFTALTRIGEISGQLAQLAQRVH